MSSITIDTKSLNAAEALEAVSKAMPQLEFQPEWANGTGYLDRLANTKLESEHPVLGFKDTHERYGVVIKTKVGNIVLFHRYTGGSSGVVVSNNCRRLNAIASMMDLGSSVSKERVFDALAWMGDVDGKWYIGTPNVVTAVAAILNDRFDDEE